MMIKQLKSMRKKSKKEKKPRKSLNDALVEKLEELMLDDFEDDASSTDLLLKNKEGSENE